LLSGIGDEKVSRTLLESEKIVVLTQLASKLALIARRIA